MIQTVEKLNQRLFVVAEEVVKRQYNLEPHIWEPYGEQGRVKAVQDMRYHLTYLIEALSANDPVLFTEYVKWAQILFTNLQLPTSMFLTSLKLTRDVICLELDGPFREKVLAYLNSGIELLSNVSDESHTLILSDNHLGNESQIYLNYLLSGNRIGAMDFIRDVAEKGIGIKDIYLHIFQPVLHEIGRLWQTNQISVGQEHFCTASTQVIMAQFYTQMFSTPRNGMKLIAASIGGELHEIGIRMVADFFEMEGWDTYYLGANTPSETLISEIKRLNPSIFALSATMTMHITGVRSLIAKIRSIPSIAKVKIIVGGFPFNISNDLWKNVGADGYGYNAQEAIHVATQLLGSTS